MKLAFQRPLWLEFTAFTAAMLGFLGHIIGLWRVFVGVGLELKIAILDFLVRFFRLFLSDNSWLLWNLKETNYVFKSFLSLPQWFQFWYHFSGVLEFAISTALFFAAIFLWHKKTYAVKWFYIIVGLSIGMHVLNILSSLLLSESLAIMKSVMDVPILLLKGCLVLIVYFADKSVLGTHVKERVNFTLTRPSLEELRKG